MKRILVTAAGGAPSLGFVRSLRDAPEDYVLIGCDCDSYRIHRAETDESYLCPRARDKGYLPFIRKLVEEEKIDFIHAQPDVEVGVLSEARETLGARTFLPAKKTVAILRNKAASYRCWREAGLRVPETLLIQTEADLKTAFDSFGNDLWLREIEGAAGKGSLAGPSLSLAREWIRAHNGWGRFTAARRLTNETVTWMALYKCGDLVVAQGRKRLYWEYADRAPSGVTGITGTGETCSDPHLDDIAQQAVFAVDPQPDGIFSVDMTRDAAGIPNPTEINVGKFFTTHYFFTRAGLNMPYIYLKLAFDEAVPHIRRKLNPLKDGLLWIRGMDCQPVLTEKSRVEAFLASQPKWGRRE